MGTGPQLNTALRIGNLPRQRENIKALLKLNFKPGREMIRIHNIAIRASACSLAAILLSACVNDPGPASRMGGPGAAGGQFSPERSAAREARLRELDILRQYDLDFDANITTAELHRGIQQDFAEADLNGDDSVEGEEISRINDLRWETRGVQASPIIDWNADGVVDVAEFASLQRNLFAQLDLDQDGIVTEEELQNIVPMRGPGTASRQRGQGRGRGGGGSGGRGQGGGRGPLDGA